MLVVLSLPEGCWISSSLMAALCMQGEAASSRNVHVNTYCQLLWQAGSAAHKTSIPLMWKELFFLSHLYAAAHLDAAAALPFKSSCSNTCHIGDCQRSQPRSSPPSCSMSDQGVCRAKTAGLHPLLLVDCAAVRVLPLAGSSRLCLHFQWKLIVIITYANVLRMLSACAN